MTLVMGKAVKCHASRTEFTIEKLFVTYSVTNMFKDQTNIFNNKRVNTFEITLLVLEVLESYENQTKVKS